MKLSDGVIDGPMTGECEIDIDKIVKCFGLSFITRWHEEYRLVNRRAHVKITIRKKDALEIIKRLDMQESRDALFKNASTFFTPKYIEWWERRHGGKNNSLMMPERTLP